MSEDLSNIINNVKNMVDSGNIPDDLKEMLGKMNNDKNANSQSNLSSFKHSKSSGHTTSNNKDFNIDVQTILRMKSIIESINEKDDPRANLLYSLKPYLRDSRKDKLDQYVNLLNISKVADIMKNENRENGNNGYK